MMIAVFGTMSADAIHDGAQHRVRRDHGRLRAVITAGSSSSSGTAREGTLSIHSITTKRRELFYWAAVLLRRSPLGPRPAT
jgi:uncharacterized membrane-anchored protein